MSEMIILALSGLLAGFVNGFFGTGGGVVIITAFLILGCDTRRALASANFGILVLSAASFFIYLSLGTVKFEGIRPLVGECVIPALAGGTLGALLSGKIKAQTLKKIFSVLVTVCGIRMVLA